VIRCPVLAESALFVFRLIRWPNSGPVLSRDGQLSSTFCAERGFAAGVGRGLRLAEKSDRRVARMHGTPIYFWKNCNVVAEKP
jgi:hypothetical protein